jgi:hypothetical protein
LPGLENNGKSFAPVLPGCLISPENRQHKSFLFEKPLWYGFVYLKIKETKSGNMSISINAVYLPGLIYNGISFQPLFFTR